MPCLPWQYKLLNQLRKGGIKNKATPSAATAANNRISGEALWVPSQWDNKDLGLPLKLLSPSALTKHEVTVAGLESLLKSSPAKLLKQNPWSITVPLLPYIWQDLQGHSHKPTYLKSATTFLQDPVWAMRQVMKPSSKPYPSYPHNFSKLSLILIL